MEIKISDMAIMVIASLAVFLGMFGFMYDLGYHDDGTEKYNISVPVEANTSAHELLRDMNKTAGDLQATLTGTQSFTQTLYNIFFNAPRDTAAAFSTVANMGAKLFSITTGPEAKIPIPGWTVMVIFSLIGLVVGFTLIYVILGRKI